MFNYEWKQTFKKAYLDVQHQLNMKYTGEEMIDADCQVVAALMVVCEKYLREREQERVQGIRRWKDATYRKFKDDCDCPFYRHDRVECIMGDLSKPSPKCHKKHVRNVLATDYLDYDHKFWVTKCDICGYIGEGSETPEGAIRNWNKDRDGRVENGNSKMPRMW